MNKFIVITSIFDPTKGIKEFSKKKGWNIVVVGDKKTPKNWSMDGVDFLSVDDQKNKKYEVLKFLPWNHYSRKMIGYLYALEKGADVIFDTDDDNIPFSHWKLNKFESSKKIVTKSNFLNIYKYFTTEHVWPRGLPLSEISKNNNFSIKEKREEIGVWQGLADRDPDVDAIFRLVFDKSINFDKKENIGIDKHVYVPFNSQNTFWRKELFPLLYLPSTVTFRFTDILRGYIAQKIMWDFNFILGFTSASVYQDRNDHDLMKDFNSEIPVYTEVEKIIDIINNIKKTNMSDYLLTIYKKLNKEKIIKPEEIKILDAWISDLNKLNF